MMSPREREEWQRWRGSSDERMKSLEDKACEQEDKIEELSKAVSAVLVKLAVPLFMVSIGGVVLGGVVMALIGRLIQK